MVRQAIKDHGLRNSLVMAIAPTATIGNITGVTQSIEPMYKNVFVKSNLSGEFRVTTIEAQISRLLKNRCNCHAERSEASRSVLQSSAQILRCAQNDRLLVFFSSLLRNHSDASL